MGGYGAGWAFRRVPVPYHACGHDGARPSRVEGEACAFAKPSVFASRAMPDKPAEPEEHEKEHESFPNPEHPVDLGVRDLGLAAGTIYSLPPITPPRANPATPRLFMRCTFLNNCPASI